MKKTLVTLALTAAVVSTGLAQGLVNFANGNGTKISTNAVAGGPATGLTFANASTTATTYYYALFESPINTVDGSSAAVNGLGNYAFEDVNWTFLNPSAIAGYVTGPGYGVNTTTAGRFNAENSDPNYSGYVTPNTTAAYWVVLGWSASDGVTLANLESWYNGGSPQTPGWIGESVVSSLLAPGNPTTTPPGTAQGVFPGAFLIGAVPVPEPATLALAGLGGLSLMLFRRQRK